MDKQALRQALHREIEVRNRLYPFKNFTLNKGQRQAMEAWKCPSALTGDYAKYNIITGGNGSGKTCLIAADVLPALCYGYAALNPQREECGLYKELCERKKRNGILTIRIVAPSVSLGRNGSLFKAINKWIPKAEWSDYRDFYHTLTINGQVIQLLSNNQSTEQHSGDSCDLIIIDEPLSSELWAENVGRLRLGGYLLNTITPLRGCDYLADIIQRPEEYPQASFSKISIYDNLEENGGVLRKSDIDALEVMWRNHPEELPARLYGDMIKLAGNVFQEFSQDKHVLEELPKDNYVYGYVIDPHLVKEPAVLVYAQNMQNEIFIIDEYPKREWHLIKHTNKTIKDFCADIKDMLGGRPMAYTLGDPNFMNVKLPNIVGTMASEYRQNGIPVSTRVNDSHYLGVGKIHEMLNNYEETYFDEETNELSEIIQKPKLYFLSKCKNMISAMTRYRYTDRSDTDKLTVNEIVETEYKCFVDCLRYACMSVKTYEKCLEKLEILSNINKPYQKLIAQNENVGTWNLW